MGRIPAVSILLLAALAAAEPLPRIPVRVVDPPPGFELGKLVTALETYVTNAELVVAPHAAAADDAVCAEVVTEARALGTRTGLWVRWVDGAMVIAMVGEAGCGARESSTVEVPSDQPAFVYRVAALKLGSMLRTLAPVVEPARVDRVDRVDRPGPLPPSPAAPLQRVLELGVAGVASGEPADRLYAASASGWVGRAWSAGITVAASLAREATSLTGTGSARTFGAVAGVRRTLVQGTRWTFATEAGVGLLGVWASADRADGQMALRDHALTPLARIAPRIDVQVAGPLGVSLGPTLDLAPRSVRFSLGDTPLYHAGLVQLRWDLRVQLWF